MFGPKKLGAPPPNGSSNNGLFVGPSCRFSACLHRKVFLFFPELFLKHFNDYKDPGESMINDTPAETSKFMLARIGKTVQ